MWTPKRTALQCAYRALIYTHQTPRLYLSLPPTPTEPHRPPLTPTDPH